MRTPVRAELARKPSFMKPLLAIEGYFSILKRGINGVFHHVSQKHLKRYLAEFDFRYNERMALGVNDNMRATKAVKGVVGKRLTYQQPDQAANA